MAKDRRNRDQKRKKKLEERKRKARQTESLAYTGKKYKSPEYVSVWLGTELGIYETFVMTNRQLLDQTVATALESLIRQLRAGTLPPLENTSVRDDEAGDEVELLIENIRRSLASRSATQGSPDRDSLIGVLRSSLGTIADMREPGPQSQGYLRHIEGFLKKHGQV